MVARALLIQPRLIIADEPVSMVDASLRATILESLRQLHVKFGISMLYITHDLTTAYQVSDNITVLYRGEVAEVGDVDHVVKNPLHPYTQLLIQSIPVPSTTKQWVVQDLPSDAQLTPETGVGCRFANRCPHAMEICRVKTPPLYRTDQGRAAACFLYQDKPELDSAELDEVMAARGRAASANPAA
jgi:peptide/nickel transport system ATP-binding protein